VPNGLFHPEVVIDHTNSITVALVQQFDGKTDVTINLTQRPRG